MTVQLNQPVDSATSSGKLGLLASLIKNYRSKAVLRRREQRRMDLNKAYRQFEIGRYSYGTPEVYFEAEARLRIGQFCSLADGVRILLGGEHRMDWITTYPFSAMLSEASKYPGHPATKGDVVLDNDVWVGNGATLLSGVHIGSGAVIGAGAIVSKSVPPYTIVAGNPARVIRTRFAERQIEALLRISWWDWPMDKIMRELPGLLSGNVDKFIEMHLATSLSVPPRGIVK